MVSKQLEQLKLQYPIQTWMTNPILRQKSISVEKIDSDIVNFADVLTQLMWEYDWVWLAAPQIWKNIRMISITWWIIKKWSRDYVKQEIMINPEIIYKSVWTEIDEEWCLSLPWLNGNVERYSEIKVKYQWVDGKIKKVVARWMNARIIQHEMDHLDWVLFADKMIKEKIDLNKFVRL